MLKDCNLIDIKCTGGLLKSLYPKIILEWIKLKLCLARGKAGVYLLLYEIHCTVTSREI